MFDIHGTFGTGVGFYHKTPQEAEEARERLRRLREYYSKNPNELKKVIYGKGGK